ncbi:PepSY domain-containing protein [Bacillus sp. Xin]|uniref:PepSY-associated TM helix domain-containing protein n=1 Tax=unclassified Bacillus (in: firmicutes) TaxID=185979 RepID=UPI001572A84B|nr:MULTISPECIES: PepSY domain-containing protein [unclassified Bacillus (in: firmicutes)]MBC6971377.1 PepSY domain-containing protein [Bacillus sp. Xin]NSW35866.1 PepSY domain-containing protein [Bacillus sp. Xin1]
MKRNRSLHYIFWRWHFYAGLFITPLLITLSLSGIGYLFREEVENVIYKDLYFGNSQQTESLSMTESVSLTENKYPHYSVTKISYFENDYNTRLTMKNEYTGDQKYVYLDKHNQIVGDQNANETFANIMRELHSSLLVGGTVVNYLVELAACWTIFLIVTGLYMSIKRFKNTPISNAREKSKRLHSIIGIVFTIPLILLVLTGLPWSGFMGKQIYNIAASNQSLGYPKLYMAPPESKVEELPWATKHETPPQSDVAKRGALSINDLEEKIQIEKPYVISLPNDAKGVFTVSKSSGSGITGMNVSPNEEITAYFDQYSGSLISKIDYRDYGLFAQWFSYGIPLHEGHLFGWPNKILCLLTTLSLLFLIYFGVKMWLARKPQGKLGAPPKQKDKKSMFAFILIMIILGISMPLFGLSVLIIFIVEFLLYLFSKMRVKKI